MFDPDGEIAGRTAYQLLGTAWRSTSPSTVTTGGLYDVVQVPETYAGAALASLRTVGACVGAVYTDGNGQWVYFVPPGSYALPWPPSVSCLSDPSVQITIPERAARGHVLRGPRWISRGEPAGRLLTSPTILWAVLNAHIPAPDNPPPAVEAPSRCLPESTGESCRPVPRRDAADDPLPSLPSPASRWPRSSGRCLAPAVPSRDRSRQLAALINTRISDGTWAPGHRFTWPQLAVEYSLDHYEVTTVLAPALRALRDTGAVETRPCAGSRVTSLDRPWPPDAVPRIPFYKFIERELRRRLDAGLHPAGSRFPSTAILAEEFAVAASTVKSACRVLMRQGLLVNRYGNTTVTAGLSAFTRDEVLTPQGHRTAGPGGALRAFGEVKTLSAWAADDRCRVSLSTLHSRCTALGWSLEDALSRAPQAPFANPRVT